MHKQKTGDSKSDGLNILIISITQDAAERMAMSSDGDEYEEEVKGRSIVRRHPVSLRNIKSRGKARLEVEYEMPEDSSKEKVTT
ncbi:hypothetical protein E2C01_073178 [Portunus trituberculatus]|uniref:Uncharacterized protein n=1 Tax=Portunus trituberculatus TaxID=210409 RepID=A0A5B7I966_PORTR|nr:hypothetical protein [Portunus trituberculatus]